MELQPVQSKIRSGASEEFKLKTNPFLFDSSSEFELSKTVLTHGFSTHGQKRPSIVPITVVNSWNGRA
jgi:hypothetical protein